MKIDLLRDIHHSQLKKGTKMNRVVRGFLSVVFVLGAVAVLQAQTEGSSAVIEDSAGEVTEVTDLKFSDVVAARYGIMSVTFINALIINNGSYEVAIPSQCLISISRINKDLLQVKYLWNGEGYSKGSYFTLLKDHPLHIVTSILRHLIVII